MYQIVGYIVYLIISSFITIYVGYRCYLHGLIYLTYLMADIRLCIAINRMLLLGYYLVNIGYIIWSISTWKIITNWASMLNELGFKIGGIMLILCALYSINITLFYIAGKKIIHFKNRIS